MATARRHCIQASLLSLLAGFVCGCSQGGPSLPRVLRLTKGSTTPGALNVEESVRDRRVIKDLQALVQDFDPGLHLHTTSHSEAHLLEEIARQSASGLGPDLIITNGNTALTLLEAVANDHPQVLDYPPAQAFVADFADSAVNYRLRFWVANPLMSFSVGSDLRRAIWTRFEQEGISIPFPQRQIYSMQWPPNRQQSLKPTEEIGSERRPPLPEKRSKPNPHDP